MTISLTTVLVALAGILMGVVVTYLLIKNKVNSLRSNLENSNRQLQEAKTKAQADLEAAESHWTERLNEVKADEQRHYEVALAAEVKAHEETLAARDRAHEETLTARDKAHDDAMRTLKERFDETIAKVVAENKSATEEMLKARQKEFAESSSTSIGQIVTPLKETIAKMEETMQKSSKDAVSINSAMKENLEQMIRQSKATQATTEELTKAFKHQSKVQGDWGEAVLTELLTSQGLTEGIQFDTQATIRDATGETVRSEEGALLRPDVILHLDQKREVIIDSKVSLTAFFDYVNAENDADRQRFLKAHVESLQKHVKELSKKDYASYIRPPKVKMDYVIMFVPHTGAFWTALNEQPDLWRKAMEQNVFIADEQSLYAALKIIHMTWTQIKQAQNHEEVFRLASEMVDRVGQFVKKYDEVGVALEKARAAYEGGRAKFEDHGQSILLTANKLKKLGAKSNKNPIPEIPDIEEPLQIE